MSKPSKPKTGNNAVNTIQERKEHNTQKPQTRLTIGNETFLDNSDLRQSLNVTARTLLNWRKQGLIKFHKLGGKIFYCERELLQLLELHNINMSK